MLPGSAPSCMGTGSHRPDGQPRRGPEEMADAGHLVIEPALLRGRERIERLHRDVELPAGTALMPDTGDGRVDQQHREVAGLTAGHCTLGGPAWKEPFAWLKADRVGV